jgi:hypothetical protein
MDGTMTRIAAAALMGSLAAACATAQGTHAEGRRLLDQGNAAGAVTRLEEARRKAEDLGAADRGAIELDLARAYFATGRKRDAVTAAERASTLRAGDPEAAWQWAAVLAQSGAPASEVTKALDTALARGFDQVRRFTDAAWLKGIRESDAYGVLVGRLLLNAGTVGAADVGALNAAGGLVLRAASEVVRAPAAANGTHCFFTGTVHHVGPEAGTGVTRVVTEPDDAPGTALVVRMVGSDPTLAPGRRIVAMTRVVGSDATPLPGRPDQAAEVALADLLTFRPAAP